MATQRQYDVLASPFVLALLASMDRAVDFDGELACRAVEVDDDLFS